MLNDLELIKQLEKEIGKKLEKIDFDEVEEYGNNGFALNEKGEVIGLNLDFVKLKLIPQLLSQFLHLEKLRLVHTGVSDVSTLGELKNLTTLCLCSNNIRDIFPLGELKNLATLDLRNNQITELPEEIVELGMGIYGEFKFWQDGGPGIWLSGNPIETPPMEILGKGEEAIKTYFKDLKKGKILPLNEVKVLLVGDGGAGKTSLVKQLLGQTFDRDEAQTDGINIEDWKVQKYEKEINAHIWDFGGQEIMHATHQFFLSKRSLYILVLDSRKDEKTEYWLKHIESFGGDSPVLVVINKIDENPGFDVNRKFLQEKYKNIKGFHRVSCKTTNGINTFITALEEALAQMEMIKTTWAEAWFNVKKQLEHMDDHFISYTRYLDLCTGEKVDEKASQDTLVDFLNDLGVVLHFKDLALEDTYVLEPKWVTEAVYKIINSEILAKSSGVLKLNLLGKILEQKDEDDYYYPPDKHRYIIELMNKFELCYKLDGERVLIPDLLEVEESRFYFDYRNSLKFIIEYDFLPKSVMPRFIVRMHKDIKNKLQWRTGVVLEDKVLHSKAVVKSDEREGKIYIYVNGEQKRDYFSAIRKTLRDINNSFEKLDTTELVPLPDKSDITVEYEELIGHEHMRAPEIVVGKLRKRYKVSQLLDGIVSEAERRKDYERIEKKGGDVYLKVIQAQATKQEQKVTQVAKQETTVSVDVKVDLPSIQFDFSDLRGILGDADPKTEKELDKIQDSLDEVSADSDKEKLKKPMNKLGRFLKKLGDEKSDFNKILKGTKKGVEIAQKVGRTYNKFAQWLALPQVPEVFLGKEKDRSEEAEKLRS